MVPWLTHHIKRNLLRSHEQHAYVVSHIRAQELQANKEPISTTTSCMQSPAQINMTIHLSRHHSGHTVWQFVLNTDGSGNSLSKNLLMSVDSPIFLPLNSRTGTCIYT